MKISLNWLRRYVDIAISPEELVKGLVSIGFDIEGVENQAEKLKNFVIGKVIERKKHPNADKLTVCKVDTGESELQNIVCGAPNVDAGQFVCVALQGAIIPNGEFEIKKSKIRGELSEGMICSAKEMNLGNDHEGIMVLSKEQRAKSKEQSEDLKIGSSFAEYIGADDVVIDIGVTPNRGDLLSHVGVAREVASITNYELRITNVGLENLKRNDSKIEKEIEVEIKNAEGCYRYCGIVVKNVMVKESPDWLKKHLLAVGLRPINNIVDVTNFVMMECGQPLHAFDVSKIAGKKIIVKSAGKTKKFKTLDGKERELREDVLLICDSEKPVALAGIMGGENSEISESTKDVFIESAYFEPVLTRKSSKFLGLQTDSSYRFERGVDIDRVDWACKRAAEMIAEFSDGEIVNAMIDNYPNKLEQRVVGLRVERVEKILGMKIGIEKIVELLGKIGIVEVKRDTGIASPDKSGSQFSIPNWRREDLQSEIDLIEEITRLNGYDKIEPAEFDKITYDIKQYANDEFDFERRLKEHFIARGFKEIISNTLVDEKQLKEFDENYIRLVNPSTSEMNVLRTNLFTDALNVVKHNLNFKEKTLKLMESGNVMYYDDEKKKLVQQKQLSLLLCGNFDGNNFKDKPSEFTIFDMKSELNLLLSKLNVENIKFNCYNYDGKFEHSLEFFSNNRKISRIARIDSAILKKFDVQKGVIVCEIYLDELHSLSNLERKFKEYSKFPPVLRDLSVVVDRGVNAGEIRDVMLSLKDVMLKEAELYDIYSIEGKMSYTFELKFQSDDRTLTDEEINSIQEKIVNSLNKKLKAELRT